MGNLQYLISQGGTDAGRVAHTQEVLRVQLSGFAHGISILLHLSFSTRTTITQAAEEIACEAYQSV